MMLEDAKNAESMIETYPNACGELSMMIVLDKSRPKMVKSLI